MTTFTHTFWNTAKAPPPPRPIFFHAYHCRLPKPARRVQIKSVFSMPLTFSSFALVASATRRFRRVAWLGYPPIFSGVFGSPALTSNDFGNYRRHRPCMLDEFGVGFLPGASHFKIRLFSRFTLLQLQAPLPLQTLLLIQTFLFRTPLRLFWMPLTCSSSGCRFACLSLYFSYNHRPESPWHARACTAGP